MHLILDSFWKSHRTKAVWISPVACYQCHSFTCISLLWSDVTGLEVGQRCAGINGGSCRLGTVCDVGDICSKWNVPVLAVKLAVLSAESVALQFWLAWKQMCVWVIIATQQSGRGGNHYVGRFWDSSSVVDVKMCMTLILIAPMSVNFALMSRAHPWQSASVDSVNCSDHEALFDQVQVLFLCYTHEQKHTHILVFLILLCI